MNTAHINRLLYDYYYQYYKVCLNVPNWNELIQKRLEEDSGSFCGRFVYNIEAMMGEISGKKILIVGAGTGGEMVYFHNKQNEVYCLEPDRKAFEILRMKAESCSIPARQISCGFGENIPFEDCSFDLVFCSSVLEHVKKYEKVLSEMLRVTKLSGKVCVSLPNYLYPCERHYKISAYPPALFPGRFLLKRLLLRQKRPAQFIKSLKFITDREIVDILKPKILAQEVVCSFINPVCSSENWITKLYCRVFNVTLHQEIIISKMKHSHV